MTLIATARRLMWAGFTALALVGSISIMRADQPASAQQTSRPGAPGPATPGERTSTPPETPQRPANPPQPAQPQAGAAATAPNPFASTYKPFPSRTTLIRNATIFTASGPVIDRGSILLVDGKIAAVGRW